MGFLKNLFKYEKIQKLKAGYAVGFVRGKTDKDLLKDGKVFEENIARVSINMLRNVRGYNESIFLIKKDDLKNPSHDYNGNFIYKDGKWEPRYDYIVIDRWGNVCFQSLNKAVQNGEIKEDLVNFDNGGTKIPQYIVNRGNTGAVLLIPSRDYVSDWYKEISEPDEHGVRKVTETDIDTKLKDIRLGRNLNYYINDVGERISPEFVDEVDAGEYKIFWAPDDKEIMYDYIYKYDIEEGSFVKQSYGYHVIDYVGGKFFAKDGSNNSFLIDETGKRISKSLGDYYVFDNGMVVGNDLSLDMAYVYDNNYKLVSTLNYSTTSSKIGVVSGRLKDEKDFFVEFDFLIK